MQLSYSLYKNFEKILSVLKNFCRFSAQVTKFSMFAYSKSDKEQNWQKTAYIHDQNFKKFLIFNQSFNQNKSILNLLVFFFFWYSPLLMWLLWWICRPRLWLHILFMHSNFLLYYVSWNIYSETRIFILHYRVNSLIKFHSFRWLQESIERVRHFKLYPI